VPNATYKGGEEKEVGEENRKGKRKLTSTTSGYVSRQKRYWHFPSRCAVYFMMKPKPSNVVKPNHPESRNA
jgi:hypothetical protein